MNLKEVGGIIICLELAHTDDKPFKEFIADRVIATQLDLLRLLNNGGANKDSGGVNKDGTINIGGANSLENELLDTIQSMPGLNAPIIAPTINWGAELY